MQRIYTLEELADFLRRPVKQLQKLAENGALNGRKVQGKWIFPIEHVVLWMENEMTTKMGTADVAVLSDVVAPEVAAETENDSETSLAGLLSVETIELNFAAKTKDSAIREITKLAGTAGKLWDPETMADALREREEMASTALDVGAAILHPRRPEANPIPENFLALAISRRGIPFGGGFNNLTDVFFLLCCQTDATYLRALGQLAKVLKTPGLLDALRECEEPRDARQLIVDAENALE